MEAKLAVKAIILNREMHKPLLIIAYLCYTHSQQVQLSHEHQAYCWADRAECERLLPDVILKDFHAHHVFELVGLK